jgi:hypothetical protein
VVGGAGQTAASGPAAPAAATLAAAAAAAAPDAELVSPAAAAAAAAGALTGPIAPAVGGSAPNEHEGDQDVYVLVDLGADPPSAHTLLAAGTCSFVVRACVRVFVVRVRV